MNQWWIDAKAIMSLTVVTMEESEDWGEEDGKYSKFFLEEEG